MKKLKPYLYLATDFLLILAGVATFAAAFYQMGRFAESKSATHPEVERAAWEMFAGREGK
jgi:hypothetical protein